MEDDHENKTKPSTSKAERKSNADKKEGKRENRDKNDENVSSRDSTMTVYNRASTSYFTSESGDSAPTPTIDPNAKSDAANLHMLTRAAGRVQSKRPKNKRRARKTVAGRVQKKKRTPANRQVVIRAPRRRARRAQRRDASRSSIHSLTSEMSVAPVCSHCGHCCCRWRLELELRAQFCGSCRKEIKKYLSSNYIQKTAEKSQKSKRTTIKTSTKNRKSLRSEAIQIGSRCSMLSPLLISRNVVEKDPRPQSNYYEITPEMIYAALRQLTMWSEFVPSNFILNYLAQNYPVNWNKQELMAELVVKLNICEKIGIVTKSLTGETWRLSCKLMNRNLQPNHVNLFWQLYHDPLRPVGKKGTEGPER